MKKYSHDEADLNMGDKVALAVSRFMSAWWFFLFLSVGTTYIIWEWQIFSEGKAADNLNIGVSLYTIFVELMLLRAGQTARNIDRALTEKIDNALSLIAEQTLFMIEQDARIIKLEQDMNTKLDKILDILYAPNNQKNL